MLRTMTFSRILILLLSWAFLGQATQNGGHQNSLINDEKRMFLILLTYIQPLARVDELVPAHVEFLKECYERSEFIFSGPRIPRTGGIILANVDSLDAVWDLIKEDPFYTHQIAEFEVIEFKPWMYDPRFDSFMKE